MPSGSATIPGCAHRGDARPVRRADSPRHCRPCRDAQIEGVTPSQLEARGLVVRRPNRDDRREEPLEPDGLRAGSTRPSPGGALAFERRMLSVLTPAEQAILVALVEKLDRQARRLARLRGPPMKLYTYFRSSAAYRVRIAST